MGKEGAGSAPQAKAWPPRTIFLAPALRGSLPTDHSSCQKTRINYLSYDIKILPQISIA